MIGGERRVQQLILCLLIAVGSSTISHGAVEGFRIHSVIDGSGVPLAIDGSGVPLAIDGSGVPLAIDGSGVPLAIDGSGMPLAIDGSGVPLAINGSGVPLAIDGSGVPLAIDGSGMPLAIDGSGVPLAIDGSGVPLAIDGSGVPLAIDGSGVPLAIDGSGVPLAIDGSGIVILEQGVRILAQGPIDKIDVKKSNLRMLGQAYSLDNNAIERVSRYPANTKWIVFGKLLNTGTASISALVPLQSIYVLGDDRVVLTGSITRVDTRVASFAIGRQIVDYSQVLSETPRFTPRHGAVIRIVGIQPNKGGKILADIIQEH